MEGDLEKSDGQVTQEKGVTMGQEAFKTRFMGGYDKDDVQEQIQRMRDEAMDEQARLKKIIAEKDSRITELNKRLELKEEQQERLEEEIKNKYQIYIDKYDSIAKLVFEAQVRADDMVKDATDECEKLRKKTWAECNRMREEAEEEARRTIDSIQQEVDDKLAEGKKRYVAVQNELNEIVELINQAQKRFMASYKEVHNIINAMPESLSDMEYEEDAETEV